MGAALARHAICESAFTFYMVLDIMIVWLRTSSPLYPPCILRKHRNRFMEIYKQLEHGLQAARSSEVQSKDPSQSELPRRFVESSVLYLCSEGTRKEGATRQRFFVVPPYLQANVGRKPGNS